MRVTGLYREAEYSPGRHRSNDALLLEQVAGRLRAAGWKVDLSTIGRLESEGNKGDLVFSMCQGAQALQQLAGWEADGARIVNSPRAALNTYRNRLPHLMRMSGVPFPPTTMIRTAEASSVALNVNGGVWLKRGDVHASITADVQWVDTACRLRDELQQFALRGITNAAVQPHVTGEEIKFYGVGDGAFFYWFCPRGQNGDRAFDPAALAVLARRAAVAAGLDIYGGDVIVSPSGELTLIDLNDWPSFAPCREAAADAIAQHLMRRVDAVWNPGFVSSANESAV